MASILQKILQMVRKTGDRVIVLEASGEEAFVLMDLASYEKLQGCSPTRLTAPQTKDKIEPDIAAPARREEDELIHLGKTSFAGTSEERLMEDERFHLEPIE